MQDCFALSAEEMDKFIEIRLDAIDRENGKTSAHVEAMRDEVSELAKQVSKLEGTLSRPLEKPWWFNSIVVPLVVIALAAIPTELISLHIKVSRIASYLQDNGGFIAGLRLEKATPTDPQKAKEAEHVLSQARRAKIKISPDVIEEKGGIFVIQWRTILIHGRRL